MRPRSMMPTRSASSSASSRYWVVRKMVMPSSALRRRTSSHTRGAADGIEAGGRLVEEQHLGVVHERGGEVEPALHAAGVGLMRRSRRRRCRSRLRQLVEPLTDLARVAARTGAPAAAAAPDRSGGRRARRPASATPMRRRTAPGSRDDVVSGDDGPSRRRAQQRAQHAHRGGLARRRSVRGSRRSRLAPTARSMVSTATVSPKVRRKPSAMMESSTAART